MTFWKILLAEDDADDQKLFCDFLSHRKDIVIMPVAENGEELLKVLEFTAEGDLPHIIVLDQNMPRSNGLQTLTTLKAQTRFANLPVVIYSTYVDEHLVNKGKAAGAALVIAKPIAKKGYDEMMDAILDLLNGSPVE